MSAISALIVEVAKKKGRLEGQRKETGEGRVAALDE